MMAIIPLPLSSSSSHSILHRLLRPLPLLTQPISFAPRTPSLHITPVLSPSTHIYPFYFSHSHSLSSKFFPSRSLSTSRTLFDSPDDAVLDNESCSDDNEAGDGVAVLDEGVKRVLDSGDADNKKISNSKDSNTLLLNVRQLPSLTIKEKKELASYAHSLGKKLKSQQIGKSGVTETVITALIETLEKNELLKLKIHGNCPAELDDAVQQVEVGTGSVAVSQIGRTVILYRPSLTKLQAEEKKRQSRRIFMKKQSTANYSLQSKVRIPKLTAGGRRGSNRD